MDIRGELVKIEIIKIYGISVLFLYYVEDVGIVYPVAIRYRCFQPYIMLLVNHIAQGGIKEKTFDLKVVAETWIEEQLAIVPRPV